MKTIGIRTRVVRAGLSPPAQGEPLSAGVTFAGSIHTTAERRARWGGDAIAEGFIRLSVGCEDDQDLVADLSQALDFAHS
jgi:cystathionine beta-lyase/cystathionine gamma-synthase